ncbi:helix-turn-helix domain-containing protein [Muribacter muris]|uniref:Helix-turn-helix domain-containing protein n=1 Tax=Muribacter muris TaxID=67855 RepID=A0A4Y9JVN1_9PAST|nr:S24 family peptidase [Muribacter muris]MBF0785742.1 helix-turn-helix domain-containing protein [Muribacter muris]MBF0828286.1 helix-turn-helix domain-containing protein [Muribacter muris]TFV08565.1 helix-turn-helix domain-containing protein [Muribacter muris]
MELDTIGQRIRARRKELKLTQKDVAKAIKGVSHVAISQWESDTTKPNAENIFDLAIALECELTWLLKGEGNVSKATPATQGTKVPIISYVQAGMWTDICDRFNSTGYEYLMTDLEISEYGFALEITGDSMEPDFKESDYIIVDPEEKPATGEFVVAINGDYEATFKKYRETGEVDELGRVHFELIPLNPDYPKMYSNKQEIRIIGTMIEHRIYRRKR